MLIVDPLTGSMYELSPETVSVALAKEDAASPVQNGADLNVSPGVTVDHDPPSSSLAEKLRYLRKLREAGVLSEKEYQQKKAAIIQEL